MSKFRLWDKRFSEFVEDFFVSKDGKIYKKINRYRLWDCYIKGNK